MSLVYLNVLSQNILTLFLFPPTDMKTRKPKPQPLAYTRALIASEKKAVARRTAERIDELTGGGGKSPKWRYDAKIILICTISLAMYTVLVTLLTQHCQCTCNL